MQKFTRRKFIKSSSILGVSIPFSGSGGIFDEFNESFSFQSPFMKAVMRKDYPQLTSLWIDSLGKNKAANNPLLANDKINAKYTSKNSAESISYWTEKSEKNSSPAWKFIFSEKSIRIISEENNQRVPFNITINQELNHATVLGIMKERNKVSLPCLIHLPDMGTFRVTSNVPGIELVTDARRWKTDLGHNYVSVSFPSASKEHPQIIYQLEVVCIYPHLADIEKDSLYDGFKRNFINIFQINPRLRALANNSTSDTCAFTLYMSAQLARYTPPFANGLTAMDLVKMTLERYICGMKAYGLAGYTANYEGANTVLWKSEYDSLDSYPSLLMAACYYLNSTNDNKWLEKNITSLIDWADTIINRDIDGDGLIESPLNGNYGFSNGSQLPSNWWDTIGFGHKDAYSNALAYQALNLFGEILKNYNGDNYNKYLSHSAKLKSIYFSTFYNPETGVLAGWKSLDGELHDYYFTFVNSTAVSYGLINTEQGNMLMDNLLSKMKTVGFTDFSLGLPGNLIPVKKGDYMVSDRRWGGPSLEDGTDSFQIYNNGGATACFTYFTVHALKKLKRTSDAELILTPILKSIKEGNFNGKCANGMSKDWKTWKGECWGYEGFLSDGYMVLLACLGEK
ncbi:MAG: hypothetical protein AB2L24_11730 [Mangrovibacterium sp.]